MNTAVPVSPRVRKALRWVEWVILIDCGLANVLLPEVVSWPGPYWRLILFVAAVGALSLRLPTQRCLWQRRTYITIELLLLIMAEFAQLDFSWLFELFIIKACLLLPRRDVILATMTTVGIFLTQQMWHAPVVIEEMRSQAVEPALTTWNLFLDASLGSVSGSIFIVMLGFVFAAEQRSRHQAEALTHQVEALATKLERARIARDIHDSLGHSLTTLDVQLALAQRYSEAGPVKLRQSIQTAQQLTTQCLTEVRQSLQTLRESNVDLTAALHTLSDQMRQSFVIDLRVRLPALPPQLSYQLYLIAKEGLINVQKHANATQTTLSMVATADQIVFKLADNGCGFDASTPHPGYGLQGIKERSQLLGGQLTVKSQPQQGTQLQLTVPLVWREKE